MQLIRKNGKLQPGNYQAAGSGLLLQTQGIMAMIPVVGPVWKGGESLSTIEDLRSCILNTLGLADKLRLRSISIPALSIGPSAFPRTYAPRSSATTDYLHATPGSRLSAVRFISQDPGILQAPGFRGAFLRRLLQKALTYDLVKLGISLNHLLNPLSVKSSIPVRLFHNDSQASPNLILLLNHIAAFVHVFLDKGEETLINCDAQPEFKAIRQALEAITLKDIGIKEKTLEIVFQPQKICGIKVLEERFASISVFCISKDM